MGSLSRVADFKRGPNWRGSVRRWRVVGVHRDPLPVQPDHGKTVISAGLPIEHGAGLDRRTVVYGDGFPVAVGVDADTTGSGVVEVIETGGGQVECFHDGAGLLVGGINAEG